MEKKESFRPKAHKPPNSFIDSIRYTVRLMLDFQVVSVYRHVKPFLKKVKGNLLDLGCGESPYRFLVDEKCTKYFGVDIVDAGKFDYQRTDITHFDGKNIPFSNEYFNYVICTEVLEHIEDYQAVIDEVYRTLKIGGEALFTVPWSARYHYIPYDYFRYTPSLLQKIFSKFNKVEVIARGTDATVISSKIIVLFFRNLFPDKTWQYIFSPFWLVLTPLIFLMVVIGHLSLIGRLGSDLDPLGYTILLKK